MALSPLKFARRFEAFKAELRTIGELDNALMYVVAFWPELRAQLQQPGSETYLDEYRPELFSRLTDDTLPDLTIEELESISRVLDELPGATSLRASPSTSSRGGRRRATDPAISASRAQTGAPSIGEARRLVLDALAWLRACAGDTHGAIRAAAEAAGEEVELPDSIDFGGLDESGRLALIAERHLHDFPQIRRAVISLHARLNDARDELHDDQVWCLFVEKNGDRSSGRSRMRRLEGEVRQESGVVVRKDTVAFDSHTAAADDPFVGVTYQALEAVRRVATYHKLVSKPERPLRADLKVIDSKQHFTGDSIGLGAALVSYTQLMKADVRRHEQKISGEVAVTGAIDAGGRIAPVNESTLPAKVRRAFFSHVRYLVVPQANLAAAQSALDSLEIDYPHRRLRLIGVDFLDEIIDNHNIIRPQRVCPIDYVSRRARRVTRSTWVQVPLLLVLLAVAFLVYADRYPMFWPQSMWFDWNPAQVDVTDHGFIVRNADGVELWDTTYNCNFRTDDEDVGSHSQYTLADLDEDGLNEVLLVPGSDHTAPCEPKNLMLAHDHEGHLLFVCTTRVWGQYPGDSVAELQYYTMAPEVLDLGNSKVIRIGVVESNPARGHNIFWSPDGDMLGWYITSGYTTARSYLLDGHSLCLIGYNNRLGRAYLAVVDPATVCGVGPPYGVVDGIDLSQVSRADHVAYIVFPITDVRGRTHSLGSIYSWVVEVKRTDSMKIEVDVSSFFDIEASEGRAVVYYYFERGFRIHRAVPTDEFVIFRDSLVNIGLLDSVNWSAYCDTLKRAVEYWTDSGWVTEGQLRDAGL